jgi:PmbA protein
VLKFQAQLVWALQHQFAFHNDQSMGITVYKNHVKGTATTSSLLFDDLKSSVAAACNIATYAQADEYAQLPPAELLAKNIPDLHLYNPFELSLETAMDYALKCEASALDFNPQISNSNGASITSNSDFSILANSNGFCEVLPSTRYSGSIQVIATNSHESMQEASEYTVASEFNALMDMSQVGRSAAEQAIAKLGSTKIATTNAPVLFVPKVAKKIIGSLISAISGSRLYRQSSFCNNKLHTKIFPEFINIFERPLIPKAIGSAPFDNDGLATYDKDLIRDGVLATYLLSYYSAQRLGMQSTANAGGVHNVILQAGSMDFINLLKTMHKGLVITGMMGHGTNIVTGDFSHGVSGFWVENGIIVKPVHEITIASNLLELFNKIIAVGNDVDYRGNIITGSILVDQMTIAGA